MDTALPKRDMPDWPVAGHPAVRRSTRRASRRQRTDFRSQFNKFTHTGRGRVLASEVLMVTPAVRNLIRDEKTEQILISMQTGAKFGMQTMNQSLLTLIQRRKISKEEALNRTTNPDELLQLLSGPSPGPSGPAGGSARSAGGSAATGAPGGSPFAKR